MKHTILALFFAFVLNIAYTQTFEWVRAVGENENDSGNSVAIDALGNVYTTGYFEGTVDFDPGPNVFNLSSFGSAAFILKLDPLGNFVWAKKIVASLFGTNTCLGLDIAFDNIGNLYCTGVFSGTVDFNPSNLSYTLTSSGERDIFILKLDAIGNFVWAKKMGGLYGDFSSSLEIDNWGNVYTTGYFSMTADFDPGVNVFNLNSAYYWDIYVSKLDAAGNFIWAKQFAGGMNSDAGYSLDIDATGNVYITGEFSGIGDFDPNIGVTNLSSAGQWDVFILKLDSAGNLLWAKQLGGLDFDMGCSLALDAGGNVYINGYFKGIVDFDPNLNIFNLNSGSNYAIFVLKLDGNGDFIWAKQIKNFSTFYQGTFLNLDNSGNPYITASFFGTVDFDPSANTFYLSSPNNYDIFITKLDTAGNFVWAKQMGGAGEDLGAALALDAVGNVYSTGFFENTADFNTEIDTFLLSAIGNKDIYIHKINQCATLQTLIDTACDIYSLNGQSYITSGNYTQTFTNLLGCDSTILLSLTINNSSNLSISQSACDNYTLNGQTYTSTGIYTQTFTNSVGCDSVISLDLTIHSTHELLTVTSCKFYNFDNETYLTSGIYPHTYTNIWGCDSIITLDLTIINALNTSITQNGASLTANQTNATYQWLDCNTNSLIIGATSQVFTPTINGNYAVILSENNCSDTSDCYLITGLSFAENSLKSQIQAYPNPTTGMLSIDLGAEYAWAKVKVCSLIGQELLTEKYTHLQLLSLQMPEMNGIYFVEITLQNGEKATVKVVVSR